MLSAASSPAHHHAEKARNDSVLSTDRAILTAIATPGISFAIWRRSLGREASGILSDWLERDVPDFDRVIADETPQSALSTLRSLQQGPWLIDDVEKLLVDFRRISESHRVCLTLGVKRTDACRKFHADFVRLRLITT